MSLKLILGICLVASITGFGMFWIYRLQEINVFLSLFAGNFTTALITVSYFVLYNNQKVKKHEEEK